MSSCPVKVAVGIPTAATVRVAVPAVSIDASAPVIGMSQPVFEGEYEYTPTPAEQTIPIAGMAASKNITINPIPSNYGLITWDGATITVS